MNGGNVSLRSIIKGYAFKLCTTSCMVCSTTRLGGCRSARHAMRGCKSTSSGLRADVVELVVTRVVHIDQGACAACPNRGWMKACGDAQVSKSASSAGGVARTALISRASTIAFPTVPKRFGGSKASATRRSSLIEKSRLDASKPCREVSKPGRSMKACESTLLKAASPPWVAATVLLGRS